MNTATMQTTATLDHTFIQTRSKSNNPVSAFFTWCINQEKHRLLWTGIMLSLHGCVLTPITVLLVAMTGVNMLLISISVFAMTFVLISNLAALPTKFTLPIFTASVITDILVIAAALSM